MHYGQAGDLEMTIFVVSKFCLNLLSFEVDFALAVE